MSLFALRLLKFVLRTGTHCLTQPVGIICQNDIFLGIKYSTTPVAKVLKSNMGPNSEKCLIWVDLEMTGLDINRDEIIEIACIITDPDLNIVAEGPNLVINVRDEVLDGMDNWCKKHHGDSGLTKAVRESNISVMEAEQRVLEFVQAHTSASKCPLAGNSVHADKKFIDKYMPRLSNHLHYRIVDVSTVKELCRRWYPDAFQNAPKKAQAHRALGDIKESIKEMQYYRKSIFKSL